MSLLDLFRSSLPDEDEPGLNDVLDESPAGDEELGKPEGYPVRPFGDGAQDPEATQ